MRRMILTIILSAVASLAVVVLVAPRAGSTAKGTSCTNGNGRGWETGYDDARMQCFDATKRGGPDTLWCITWYRNGNAQGSCQWASTARR